MDFVMTLQNGRPAMSFDKADTIFNNVYLSLTLRRGSWFQNPDFGSRLHLLKKNTPRAAALAESYAREALRWLLDAGKATVITVTAQRDTLQDLHRLKLWVEVTQADGRLIAFDHYVEVV